jgi:hypothetical protein
MLAIYRHSSSLIENTIHFNYEDLFILLWDTIFTDFQKYKGKKSKKCVVRTCGTYCYFLPFKYLTVSKSGVL